MEIEQTKKVLNYIASFGGVVKTNPQGMILAWHSILKDYSYEEVKRAIKIFIKTDKRHHFTIPPVGSIVEIIDGEKQQSAMFREMIENNILRGKEYYHVSGHISEEDYEKLKLKLIKPKLNEKNHTEEEKKLLREKLKKLGVQNINF